MAVPTSAPLPAASTISGRLVLELSIVAGLLQNVLSFFLSIAGTIVGVAGTTAVAVVTKLLWPMVMKPLLMPAVFVSRALVLGSVNAAVGLWVWLVPASQAAVTNAAQQLFAGLAALTTELDFSSQMRRTALLQKMRSSGQTLAVILLVLFIMAAGAQYTLSRRTRDFKKWDIWQAIEFGQSKPQARVEGSTGVRFADVAGINEVVQELQELVVYLKDPDRFDSMGTKPPHGVLLEGPPGCGKVGGQGPTLPALLLSASPLSCALHPWHRKPFAGAAVVLATALRGCIFLMLCQGVDLPNALRDIACSCFLGCVLRWGVCCCGSSDAAGEGHRRGGRRALLPDGWLRVCGGAGGSGCCSDPRSVQACKGQLPEHVLLF